MKNIFYNIRNNFMIYFIYAKNDIKSQIEYKIDFIIQMIVWFIYSFIPFLGLNIIFNRFEKIGQWDIYSIGILYAIVGLSYDTSRMIGRAFDDFHKLLITGDLDVFYIRPYSIIVQLFGSKFFIRRVAGLIQYMSVLAYSIINIKEKISATYIEFIFVITTSYISTLLLFLSLLLVYASICFFTIQRNIFSEVIVDSTAEIGYYPLDYSYGFIKFIFFTIIPVGLTVYLPIKNIIFSENLNYRYVILSVIIGVIMLYIGKCIFLFSLKNYSSVNN